MTSFIFRIDGEPYWGDFTTSLPIRVFAPKEMIPIHYNPSDPNDCYYEHAFTPSERKALTAATIGTIGIGGIASLIANH